MIVPNKTAAYAPLRLRLRARKARVAIRTASAKPRISWVISNRGGDDEQHRHEEHQAAKRAGSPDDEGQHALTVPAIEIQAGDPAADGEQQAGDRKDDQL